ncbi:MAG: hypothetical protein WD431_20170 [Cyclobacteriaceae bacterium]
MKKKKIIKISLIVFVLGAIIAGSVAYYLYNKPHRDIQATKADYQVEASKLVEEYLSDPDKANKKYLGLGGESKVLEVSGTVASISEDFNNQKVVLLKSASDKAGVKCTFLESNDSKVDDAMEGKEIIVKGVIRSGASYDEDFEMYEHVILEKCALIEK